MFTQLNIYKNLIIGGIAIALLVGLYTYIGSLKTQIDKLEIKVGQWQVKYSNEQRQSDLLRNAVKTQNAEVTRLKHDKELADIKLSDWKAKPAVIKYKTITKVRTVRSNECPEVKSIINTVRQIDFDTL